MRVLIDLVIEGDPVGAARPRVTRGGARTYMPANHREWEGRAVAAAAERWAGQAPLDEPVRVSVEAWHSRPKRLRRRKDPRQAMVAVCKPDLDNVVKLALDALVKAGVLVDDTRVTMLVATRWYCPIDATGQDAAPARVRVCVGVGS